MSSRVAMCNTSSYRVLLSHGWPAQLAGALVPDQNTAARAVALLDDALMQRFNSGNNASTSQEPADASSQSRAVPNRGAADHQKQQVRFVVLQVIEAPQRATAPVTKTSKVCWKVTVESASKPGPICPSAPVRPRPPVVLVPAEELGGLCNHLRECDLFNTFLHGATAPESFSFAA